MRVTMQHAIRLIIFALTLTQLHGREMLEQPAIHGVKKIEFQMTTLGEDGKSVKIVKTVEKPETVKLLADAITLIPKQPCLCDHRYSMVIHTENEKIEAKISDHSLDIVGPKGNRYYRMPAKLWKQFRMLTKWE